MDFVGFQLLKIDQVISIEKSVGDAAVWGAGTLPPIPFGESAEAGASECPLR